MIIKIILMGQLYKLVYKECERYTLIGRILGLFEYCSREKAVRIRCIDFHILI